MFMVNRSGLQFPVWNSAATHPNLSCPLVVCSFIKDVQRGTILANEFYRGHLQEGCRWCGEAGHNIVSGFIEFLGPTGWDSGFLHGDVVSYESWEASRRFVSDFPLRTEAIGGGTQGVFRIQNRAEELRARDGTIIASLAVGTEIASSSIVMGQTFRDHWLIEWVRRGGVWTRADNRPGHDTWAFVDTGLRIGSNPWSISIRTSLAE